MADSRSPVEATSLIPPAADAHAPAAASTTCWVFSVVREDRQVEVAALAGLDICEDDLLWVDMLAPGAAALREVADALRIVGVLATQLHDAVGSPVLVNTGEQFLVRMHGAQHDGSLKFSGNVLRLVCGPAFVLTCHDKPLPFVDEMQQRQASETQLGELLPESFAAALLDWHLESYFTAAARVETAADALEERILTDSSNPTLAELRDLRRAAARLRRMLASHRPVFSGLSRPDFRPTGNAVVNPHFARLESHYERAMDVIENLASLVTGAFELFSGSISLRTNQIMHVLTFVTVLTGVLAVIAGVLGMNFEAPFFKSAHGFLIAVIGLAVLGVGAVLYGLRSNWLPRRDA